MGVEVVGRRKRPPHERVQPVFVRLEPADFEVLKRECRPGETVHKAAKRMLIEQLRRLQDAE